MAKFEEIMRRYPSESFKRGAALFLKGDAPRDIYVIERGTVKAYTITSEGVERQIALQGPGEDIPIGFSSGMAEKVEYFYEVYSRECTLRRIPREAFLQALQSDSELLYQFYVFHDKQLRALLARINALDRSRAGDKVAFMLMQMSDQIGTLLRPSKTRSRLTLTQQEIADMVGLTRETTGIELKKLELKKILSHTRKNYVLYVERLKKYLDEK